MQDTAHESTFILSHAAKSAQTKSFQFRLFALNESFRKPYDAHPGAPVGYSWSVAEFWQENSEEDRKFYLKQVLKWSLLFLALCVGIFFAFWWSSSAIHFGASRVNESTAASYVVHGIVVDGRSGAAIPWANIEDDPNGRPPFFQALGDIRGEFEMTTIPEPHYVYFSALGYKPRRIKVGKSWYLWMPSGKEDLRVALDPEH